MSKDIGNQNPKSLIQRRIDIYRHMPIIIFTLTEKQKTFIVPVANKSI